MPPEEYKRRFWDRVVGEIIASSADLLQPSSLPAFSKRRSYSVSVYPPTRSCRLLVPHWFISDCMLAPHWFISDCMFTHWPTIFCMVTMWLLHVHVHWLLFQSLNAPLAASPAHLMNATVPANTPQTRFAPQVLVVDSSIFVSAAA